MRPARQQVVRDRPVAEGAPCNPRLSTTVVQCGRLGAHSTGRTDLLKLAACRARPSWRVGPARTRISQRPPRLRFRSRRSNALPASPEPHVDLSVRPADEVKTTTCYMCACRCGINVHLKDGKVRYIEGNRDHPVNKGVLCAKGSAGIMQHYSPARLRKPLLRVGERGSGEFQEIEWDEALAIADAVARATSAQTDPRKLAFFTGRDQSQALTGWWAKQFGTPNYAAHGGFCSVNMAAGGLYTIGGSFWEFGEPDWDHTRYFMLFGVAEDHDSNPIKIGARQAEGARRQDRLGQPGAHRLHRHRRRMDRHPARHRRAVRAGAGPRAAARRRRIDLDYLVALHQRAVAGDPRSRRRRRRPVRARRRRQAARLHDKASGKLVDALPAPTAARRCRAAFTLADGRKARAGLPADGRALSSSAEYAPEAVGGALRRPRRRPSAASPPSWRMPRSSRRSTLDIPWTDWTGRRHEKMIGRPGRHARDARHLRPFQRLPHLPRAAPPADAARRDRLPRRLPLQAALPEAGAAVLKPRGKPATSGR